LKYYYNIFGLTAGVNFKLHGYPETMPVDPLDVHIRKGKVNRPKDGIERTVYKPFSVISEHLYFLDVPEIAKYKVEKGKKIVIEKYPQASWQDVFAFLFDTVFTILLLQNGIFVFHAMAVAFGKKAILFCGPSGIGKSTLAAYLVKNKKAKIIEDDKCLLELNPKTQRFQIKNHIPFIELWQNNAGLLKDHKNIKPINKVRENIPKIRFDITHHVPKRSVALDKIVLLSMKNLKDEIIYKEITGIQKVNIVKNHTHMDHYVSVFKKNKEHFQTIKAIVNGIEVHSINKSRLTSLPDFIKYIEDEII